MRIHAPLNRGVDFRIDSHVMSMLTIFHGKPSEDPYRHVDELSQVCEINHLQNVPADTMKMKLFPTTLRDRAKDWFLKSGKKFTSVTKNSHHNAAKLVGRGAMLKGQLINAKSAKTGMLLERIDKMAEVQNLLLDRLNIRNGSKGLALVSLQESSPCANC